MTAELQNEIREYLAYAVAAGFDTFEEMLESVIEIYGDDVDATMLDRYARPLIHDLLRAHYAAQVTWPTITEYDRLDAAFTALEATGIVCRHNFSCCGSCGAVEIWDEAAALEAAGKPVRGYAFYHMQDTESAVAGQGLYLNYGAADPGEAAALAIAAEIVSTLRNYGLTVEWDGQWSRRINITIDWKRRRSPPVV